MAELLPHDFKGPAKKIEDWDIGRAAHMLGVNEDVVHAVIDVETTGSGFDPEGRPKILFEPHVFYRNLPTSKLNKAISQGLACKSWGEIKYGKESEQYPRLEKAMLIDRTAALKACSWGMAQILGENFASAGYTSVEEMVIDFTLDEDNHLEAMVKFILNNNLDDELRALNWAAFARGYNGPGYAKNKYDTKMAARYTWWRTKPDYPYDPKTDPDLVPTQPEPIGEPQVFEPANTESVITIQLRDGVVVACTQR